jgi:tetratricopeptide (TPR) repeat protein
VAGALLACAGLFLIPSTSIARLKEPMAEHRAYQTGFYLILAAVCVLPDRWSQDARARGVVGLLVLALGASTAHRASIWSSEVALWREAVSRSPDSADAWFGLGDAHRFAKDCTTAAPAYSRALELAKDATHVPVTRRLDALNNLGICHAQLGDGTAARRAWLAALELRPSYCRAHTNLGSLAYRQRNWESALVELRSALAYCPDNATAHWLAGNIYYGPLRDPQKALVHYETLIRIAPRFDFAPEAKERILELTW